MLNSLWRYCHFNETAGWATDVFCREGLPEGRCTADKLLGNRSAIRHWSSCWVSVLLGGCWEEEKLV